MTTVIVKLDGLAQNWVKPCQQAVADLTALLKQNNIKVTLSTSGSRGPTITVKTDPAIQGSLVHGRTTAVFSGSGQMTSAEVRLPVKITISTPQGIRDAGPGVHEVIAAHELVHALGHEPHNSHLMGQTLNKEMGDNSADDKLRAGSVKMPPLKLSPQSISQLKAIWK